MMSVDPVTVSTDLSTFSGVVTNVVMISSYGGQIKEKSCSLVLGRGVHYKQIPLYKINQETRRLALLYWGIPRPSSVGDHPPYLFNPHTDTLGVRLTYGTRAIREIGNSHALYEISPNVRNGIYQHGVFLHVPAPTTLLSRVHQIELQLDRVQDITPKGYNWTSSGAKNPMAFLFHFPNLRHLTFTFRRPERREIPERDGRTVICGDHVVPITEAVHSFDYYHLETIQCLHAFLRLFRDRSTRGRAKVAFKNLRTITITANLKPIFDELFWFPRLPKTRVATVPKGMSPLDGIDHRAFNEASKPPRPPPPVLDEIAGLPWNEWIEMFNGFDPVLAASNGMALAAAVAVPVLAAPGINNNNNNNNNDSQGGGGGGNAPPSTLGAVNGGGSTVSEGGGGNTNTQHSDDLGMPY